VSEEATNFQIFKNNVFFPAPLTIMMMMMVIVQRLWDCMAT